MKPSAPRELPTKKARDAKNTPDTPLKQVDSNMRAVQDAFNQMTPAEQMQGITKFSMMMGQIFTSLDPSVTQNLMQQAAKFRAAMPNWPFPSPPPPGQ